MAESADVSALQEVAVVWNLPPGPAPMVNQFVLQAIPDSDGGPAEIVVRLGYVLPSPHEPSEGPLPVTTVAAFTLTRYRAEQLRGFLTEQIDNWDKIDSAVRGERHKP
jgi:hypothetical protein